MGMRIDDEIYVHGYLDEIRQDKVIIRNEGGYFGTVIGELVEAIPKAEYEARLKADMVAMLTEIQLEIEKQCKIPNNNASAYDWNNGVYSCYKVVQQKIDKLKESKNEV